MLVHRDGRRRPDPNLQPLRVGPISAALIPQPQLCQACAVRGGLFPIRSVSNGRGHRPLSRCSLLRVTETSGCEVAPQTSSSASVAGSGLLAGLPRAPGDPAPPVWTLRFLRERGSRFVLDAIARRLIGRPLPVMGSRDGSLSQWLEPSRDRPRPLRPAPAVYLGLPASSHVELSSHGPFAAARSGSRGLHGSRAAEARQPSARSPRRGSPLPHTSPKRAATSSSRAREVGSDVRRWGHAEPASVSSRLLPIFQPWAYEGLERLVSSCRTRSPWSRSRGRTSAFSLSMR